MPAPGRAIRAQDWQGAAIAVASGLALGWSFVDPWYWFLPWIAVAPLIHIAETRVPRVAFALGWLGGSAGIGCAFVWLIHAFEVFGGFSSCTALVLFAAPVLWMGLQIGAFVGALAWLGPLPLGLAAPLTFTVVEFLFPTLFPWRLAHTQHRWIALLQSGELAGPYLLGFVMVWLNAGLVGWLRARSIATFAVAAGTLAVLVGAGRERLAQVDALRSASPMLRVGVVQGNISVERKGDRSFFHRNLDEYRRLSRDIAGESDLLVWPETVAQHAIDASDHVPSGDRHPFADTPRPLVFGGLAIGDGPEGRRLYNSAFLADVGGAIIGRYDKRVLVPFGEYLPFATRFPWLRSLSPASGRFTAGEAPGVLTTSDGVRLGPLICYEDVIPDPARQAVARGAQLLLNLTNDAWYGDSAEPYQHQALALWRAVETRRDFIRSTNTGLTAAISASGEEMMRLPIFVAAARRVDVRLMGMRTFYATWGDVFAYGLVVAWIGALWRRLRP